MAALSIYDIREGREVEDEAPADTCGRERTTWTVRWNEGQSPTTGLRSRGWWYIPDDTVHCGSPGKGELSPFESAAEEAKTHRKANTRAMMHNLGLFWR